MHSSRRLRRHAAATAALSCALILTALLTSACGQGGSVLTATVNAPIGGDALARAVPADPGATAAPSTDTEHGLFLALAVGNQAAAQREFRYRVRLTGDSEPGPWTSVHATIDRHVDGVDSRDGVSYFAQTESFVDDSGNEGSFTDLLRQDRSGAYLWQDDLARTPATDLVRAGIDRAMSARGLDAATRAAFANAVTILETKWAAAGRPIAASEFAAVQPASRPGGIGPHEITLLQYPLRPGATWEGRIGFNRWTVEARERVTVPAGAFSAVRMRIEVAAFGPDDRYVTWWAAPGEVAHAAHLESSAVNDQGEIIGVVESEETQQLTKWTPGGGS